MFPVNAYSGNLVTPHNWIIKQQREQQHWPLTLHWHGPRDVICNKTPTSAVGDGPGQQPHLRSIAAWDFLLAAQSILSLFTAGFWATVPTGRLSSRCTVNVVFMYIDDNGINIKWQMGKKTSEQVKPETEYILAYTCVYMLGLRKGWWWWWWRCHSSVVMSTVIR